MIPLNEPVSNDVIQRTLRLPECVCVIECAFAIPPIQCPADGKRSHDPILAFRLTFFSEARTGVSLYTFPAETLTFANVH